MLKGAMRDVRHFAQHVVSERGVRQGQLVTVPVEFDDQKHAHDAEPGRRHLHIHVREAGYPAQMKGGLALSAMLGADRVWRSARSGSTITSVEPPLFRSRS